MAWRVECLLVMVIVASTAPCTADWTVNAQGSLFYTDDVGLFSATRRLDLHGRSHPHSQPLIALTGKGSDMVFEPDVNVTDTESRIVLLCWLDFSGHTEDGVLKKRSCVIPMCRSARRILFSQDCLPSTSYGFLRQ